MASYARDHPGQYPGQFTTREPPGLSSMGRGSRPERVGKRDGKMPTADRIASAGKCPVQVKGGPLF